LSPTENYDTTKDDADARFQYPKVLDSEVSIHVVQSRDHILNTYSEKISQYAEKRFARNDVNVVMNARYAIDPPTRTRDRRLLSVSDRVQEVTPDKVVLSIKGKNKDDKPEIVEIPSGFTLWSTGIGEF